MKTFKNTLFGICASLCAAAAHAHVGLSPAWAKPGDTQTFSVRVGHPCGQAPTLGLELQLPAGVELVQAPAVTGWRVSTQRQGATSVVWQTTGAAAANAAAMPFSVQLKLPATPSALWFKARQLCQGAEVNWVQIPARGTDTTDLKEPAALVQLGSGERVQITDGWVRPAVPGQTGTGGFLKLRAPAGAELVGVKSRVAAVSELHEMAMDSGVMRMRAIASLKLPAGETVALKPGGHHLMLLDLKQPLALGESVDVTLRFKDAQGEPFAQRVSLPVSRTPGAGAAPTASGAHAHH